MTSEKQTEGLLTETANYDEPGSWGRMSVGWPEIRGDQAYAMYVFANCVASVPYGSYVLAAQSGQYGATESVLRVHGQHIEKLKADFARAGQPDVATSIARREKYGKLSGTGNKEAAPLWTVDPTGNAAELDKLLNHFAVACAFGGTTVARTTASEAIHEHVAALLLQMPATREDGMPASADERKLRRLLCVAHEPLAYMDDGEASGQEIDYMRFSVDAIEAALQKKAVTTLAKEKVQPPADTVKPKYGIPGNFITHRNAWRKAIEQCRDTAEPNRNPTPDDEGGFQRSYWEHELAAFDRSFERLWALMKDTTPLPYAFKDLDEDSPLWLLNCVTDGLVDGLGASEDNETFRKALVGAGFVGEFVDIIHRATVRARTSQAGDTVNKHALMVEAAAKIEQSTGFSSSTALQQMQNLDASLRFSDNYVSPYADLAEKMKHVRYKSAVSYLMAPFGKSQFMLSSAGALTIITDGNVTSIQLFPEQYELVHAAVTKVVKKMIASGQAEPSIIATGTPYLDKTRDVKITSSGAAVDQDYPWDYDMTTCPEGKVQLLSIGGVSSHGKKSDAPGFYRAWAPIPKDNGPDVGLMIKKPWSLWQVNRD